MINIEGSGRFSVYAELVKYKLSLAVTFSSVTGYFIFHKSPDIALLFLSIAIFLLSSGAAALNQYTEREFDTLMARTKNRPLPLEKIGKKAALMISLILLSTGIIFLLLTGIFPALLGLFNVVLYNLVYTRLKRITSFAIIPGAVVGAVPPIIGYTAAGGIDPQSEIILFSLFMFLWQLPHFWLIIIKYRNEYAAAGFKTFSGTVTEKQARIIVFLWVFFSTLFLFCFSYFGPVFIKQINYALVPLNFFFILLFYGLLFKYDHKRDVRGPFILINSFSLLIMILFIINSFLK